MKTWFCIDGTLEKINFNGPTYLRFPNELAKFVIERFSKIDEWILDPFCGFGTTIRVANELGRHAIGFEKDNNRFQYAKQNCPPNCNIINDDVKNIDQYKLPIFDLLFTSPPYHTFRKWDKEGVDNYFKDFLFIFNGFKKKLSLNAFIILDMSNVRYKKKVKLVAFKSAVLLSKMFQFKGELVRCNTGKQQAGPGYDHSYLLIFQNFKSDAFST